MILQMICKVLQLLKVAGSCLTICTKPPVHLVSITNGEIQPQQRYLFSCMRCCFWKFHPCTCLSEALSPTCGSLFRAAAFQYSVTTTAAVSPKLYKKCKCTFLAYSGTICQGHQEERKNVVLMSSVQKGFLRLECRNEGQKYFLFLLRWQQTVTTVCKYL